MVKLLIGLN